MELTEGIMTGDESCVCSVEVVQKYPSIYFHLSVSARSLTFVKIILELALLFVEKKKLRKL